MTFPLLVSKDTMKKTNTYIDFANDKIILNKKVPVKFTTSGHYCIPMGKIVDDNHDKVLKSESILFCDDVNELSNVEKEKTAIKLHRQFSHPSSDNLIILLKDANINDKQLFDMVKNINGNCKVCQKYKKPKPKPIVSFPLAKTFTETVALDLKEWKSNPTVWFLHIIDHLTRFSASCIIKTKRKEQIIKQVFRIWVSIFGSPKILLVDNGGEFNNEHFRSLCENVNIRILTNAAELPWCNGLIERHNAIVAYTVTKTIEDAGCELELALS